MAHRRRQVAVRDVRADLAATLRRSGADYDIAVFGEPRACPVADALDHGEPVELPAWKLPVDVRRDFGPNDRVRLLPDGSLATERSASA